MINHKLESVSFMQFQYNQVLFICVIEIDPNVGQPTGLVKIHRIIRLIYTKHQRHTSHKQV